MMMMLSRFFHERCREARFGVVLLRIARGTEPPCPFGAGGSAPCASRCPRRGATPTPGRVGRLAAPRASDSCPSLTQPHHHHHHHHPKAMGFICEGYGGEPAFLGRFNMTRVQLSHE